MKNAAEINVPIQNDSSTVVMHHLDAFLNNDLKTLMTDYTDESVLITRDATYTGLKEIQNYLSGLMVYFPKGKSTLELDKIVTQDKLVYIVWHAQTPGVLVSLASDTFIIKAGKIFQQTFIGQMQFLN